MIGVFIKAVQAVQSVCVGLCLWWGATAAPLAAAPAPCVPACLPLTSVKMISGSELCLVPNLLLRVPTVCLPVY